MTFRLWSPGLEEGARLPAHHARGGADVSPPLSWSDPPVGTAAFALAVEDPDAPAGRFVHWIRWNLPGSATGTAQGVPRVRNLPDGSKQGLNGYGELGWSGPAPPPGRVHRYVFEVWAVDAALALPGGADADRFRVATAGHVLARAQLVLRYGD